jgi:hypothetical protein
MATSITFPTNAYALLLLCFLITFFFPSTLVPHHKRLALYTTTLNDEHWNKSLLLVHHCLTMTYIALLHHCSLFS